MFVLFCYTEYCCQGLVHAKQALFHIARSGVTGVTQSQYYRNRVLAVGDLAIRAVGPQLNATTQYHWESVNAGSCLGSDSGWLRWRCKTTLGGRESDKELSLLPLTQSEKAWQHITHSTQPVAHSKDLSIPITELQAPGIAFNFPFCSDMATGELLRKHTCYKCVYIFIKPKKSIKITWLLPHIQRRFFCCWFLFLHFSFFQSLSSVAAMLWQVANDCGGFWSWFTSISPTLTLSSFPLIKRSGSLWKSQAS